MQACDSEFYRWMLRCVAAQGDDPDSIVPGEGPAWRLRHLLLIWAAIALDEGLSLRQTYVLAGDLGVTPQELTAAYEPEMRSRAVAAVPGNPDLAHWLRGPVANSRLPT